MYVLDAGAALTLTSPKGGQPPLDPKSEVPEFQTELTKRFRTDTAAQAELVNEKASRRVRRRFRRSLLPRRTWPDVGHARQRHPSH